MANNQIQLINIIFWKWLKHLNIQIHLTESSNNHFFWKCLKHLNIQIHPTKSSSTITTKTSCKLVFLMNQAENYQNWKLPSWKWFLYILLKMNFSGELNWKLLKLKVAKFESYQFWDRQSWKLPKLKVSSAFLAESCQVAKLPSCQVAKLLSCQIAKLQVAKLWTCDHGAKSLSFLFNTAHDCLLT